MPDTRPYDAIVIGSGVGGSILAAHIAQHGVQPKTGERPRVAMLEAGPYWRGEAKPGYGIPSRRQRITNFIRDSVAEREWSWGMAKIVGGSTMHYGASVEVPFDVDYQHFLDAGTDWTAEACRESADEVVRMFHVHSEPDALLTPGNFLFRDAVRQSGRQPLPCRVARRNCLYCGMCEGTYYCKYDSKVNALNTYIPLAEKHGVEIISGAEVRQIVIEKRGARPVATGVVFERAGQTITLRAAKIAVSGGVVGTPVLLFRSGYGSKEALGNRLIAENDNIGRHLDLHNSLYVQGYFDQPIKDGSRGAAPAGSFFFDDAGPNGYARLRFKDSGMISIEEPWKLPFSPFAPDFGREHKEFMKQAGSRCGGINVVLKKAEGYRGSVDPATGQMLYESSDAITKRLHEGGEIARDLLNRMGARKIVGHDGTPSYSIYHGVGTCTAGADRKSSVVNSNFESHDVDNLFICDASVLPRCVSYNAVGSIGTVAALAGRRIVANHFRK